MRGKVFIDSNIFLYAFSTLEKDKQATSKNILYQNAVISTQIINEVSVNLLKKFGFLEKQVKAFVNSAFKRYYVEILDQQVFVTASNIRENYNVSYYDSVIVSTAIKAGCAILYSEDMQNNQVINESLTIINPFVQPNP